MPDPASPEMIQAAAAHLQAGRLQQAQDIYRQILRTDPNQPDALAGMGLLARQVGRHPLAAAYFGRAAQVRPDVARYHHLQGQAWLALGDFNQASACFRDAIRLDPAAAEAHFNLGIALGKLQRSDDAILRLREAVTLNPMLLDAQIELARELELTGRRDEAAAVYREIARLSPDNPNVEFHIAALTGQAAPLSMPPSLVGALFDRHAETFDQHLTEHLHYRVPQLLMDAIEQAGVGDHLTILDLGCGTGLVGELLRPKASMLVGIDLSAGMLAKARQRGMYDRIEQADVVAALRSSPAVYDLIVAGDVLCYFGDLLEVFHCAREALRPGGRFAFSVELHDGEGWALKPSRRYAHSSDYTRSLAEKTGFRILQFQAAVLRTDNDQDVKGLIVVLQRPA